MQSKSLLTLLLKTVVQNGLFKQTGREMRTGLKCILSAKNGDKASHS